MLEKLRIATGRFCCHFVMLLSILFDTWSCAVLDGSANACTLAAFEPKPLWSLRTRMHSFETRWFRYRFKNRLLTTLTSC